MAKHVDQPNKKKQTVKIPDPLKSDVPNTSDGSVQNNLSMDDTIVEFARSNSNLMFEEFETLVDTIRREVRKQVDHRKEINDDSSVSIMKYTDEAIKKHLRASKWA